MSNRAKECTRQEIASPFLADGYTRSAENCFSVAPGLPKEKSDVYVAAIKKAMNDPEYQIKELKNKNPLVYRDGKELHDAIAENEKFVNSVKYWEDAK